MAIGLVFWSYRRSTLKRKWLCGGLKILGLTLLALCVLEPQWTRQRVRPGANLMVILADNSSSLQVSDDGAGQPRAEQLRKVLDPSRSNWQSTLGDAFDLRRYQFDQRLQPVENFAAMGFDGQASGMGSALQMITSRFQGRPLAGIVLLVRGTAQRSKMGINLNPPEACPRCGVALPAMRAPKNLRQMLWGGWTCTGCGIELDKWGQPVPK